MTELARKLLDTWKQQAEDGFLLSDPATANIETSEVADPECGIRYRFRWMPHREIRGDVAELQRRGILNPDRDESKLFRDPRDPNKRHCFLCKENIAECHPLERLVPLDLAGRRYWAGANFSWIEFDHFTILTDKHEDQEYSRAALDAACDLHRLTGGAFRVLFNGTGAGASIPWHFHFQITTAEMPIERIVPGTEASYPTAIGRFSFDEAGVRAAHDFAASWLDGDRANHSLNLLIATTDGRACVFIFPRDKRHATADCKGLMGGFEVAGDFVLSAPREEETFRNASVEIARDMLSQIRPPAWRP